MKDGPILKYSALILTIIFSVTLIFAGCGTDNFFRSQAHDVYEEQQDFLNDELKDRAYHYALEIVMKEYPGSEPIVNYSPDKVIEEAPGIFEITLEDGIESIWHCVLQYYEDEDVFEAIELVREGGQKPGPEEEYIAEQQPQEEFPEEQQESLPEEQSPEEYPEEQIPQQEPEKQQPPSGQEIKERAFHAAQADVLKNYPGAIFKPDYDENYIKTVGNSYYCCIVFEDPNYYIWFYAVRYSPDEDKMHITKKVEWSLITLRAFDQFKYYIENEYSWVQNNCGSVVFDNSSVDIVGHTTPTTVAGIAVDGLPILIDFQCQNNGAWYTATGSVRYDITNDSFTDFEIIINPK